MQSMFQKIAEFFDKFLNFDWNNIDIFLPDEIHIDQPFTYLIYCWLLVVAASFILKHFIKAPHLKAALITAVSILAMAAICAAIYYYKVPFLDELLRPLPFLDVDGNDVTLSVFEFTEDGRFHAVKFFNELTALYILAFFVNQVYDYQQGNLKTPGWLIFRLISTMFCIGLHYAFSLVMEKFYSWYTGRELPETLLFCVPLFILGGIAVTYILALLKKTIGHFFKMVHLTFQGLNDFYFTKKFGTMLNRAVWTTVFLTVFAVVLQRTCELNDIVPVFTLGNYTLGVTLTLIGLLALWIIVGFIL